MPEPNKRVVVTGVTQAEKDFDRYMRGRVLAEKSAEQLAKEAEEAAREAERALREAAGRG